jgi:hypothetical protein
MNELEQLLMGAGLERALTEHYRVPVMDVNRVEAWLKERDEKDRLTVWAQTGLVALARERVCALMLDDTFVEAGCERALEPHPRLELLPIALLWGMVQNGEAVDVIAWGKERHQEMNLEEQDRFHYGWRGDPLKTRNLGGAWKRVVDAIDAVKRQSPRAIPKILCLGGNGSSKSEFMPWYAIQQMVKKKDFRVLFLCVSENWAREVAMSRMFANLPPQWRPDVTGKAKTGITGAITYTEKMGFSENKFILPNGSRCTFMFYENGNPKALEGMELDLVCADEEVPLEWIEACEYRLVRRAGALIVGFTPISGVIPTVTYFRGARPVVMEEMDSELVLQREARNAKGELEIVDVPFWDSTMTRHVVGHKKVPLVEVGSDFTKRIVYFPTNWCCYPAGNYQTLKEEFATKKASVHKMLERAHGVPTKVRDAAFPLVDVAVHAVPFSDRIMDEPPEVTWWNVLDPGDGRNAMIQWWACHPDGRKILEREWPQQDDYIPGVGQPGAWAVASTKGKKKDGDRGPAQEAWGLSYKQMADEIDRVEKELAREVERRDDGGRIHVFRRICDSRAGNDTHHGTTIIKEFAKQKLSDGTQLLFDDAAGKRLNISTGNSDNIAGITLINDALNYDTKRPVGHLNRPKLLVRFEPDDPMKADSMPRGCANTWFSLSTWTGADGEKGACKDPVDCTHYFLRDEPRFVRLRRVVSEEETWGGYGS